MLTSLYVFDIYKEIASIDPSRIAAGVITGIGFLGAGTIIRDREGVKGLTITDVRKAGSENPGREEYVWLSNDPRIAAKLKDGEKLKAGETVLTDDIAKQLTEAGATVEIK